MLDPSISPLYKKFKAAVRPAPVFSECTHIHIKHTSSITCAWPQPFCLRAATVVAIRWCCTGVCLSTGRSVHPLGTLTPHHDGIHPTGMHSVPWSLKHSSHVNILVCVFKNWRLCALSGGRFHPYKDLKDFESIPSIFPWTDSHYHLPLFPTHTRLLQSLRSNSDALSAPLTHQSRLSRPIPCQLLRFHLKANASHSSRTHLHPLPAAWPQLWPLRNVLYRCLSVHRGVEGVCLSACWVFRPLWTRQTPDYGDPHFLPNQADTPLTRQTPNWPGRHLSPDQAIPPRDQADTPPWKHDSSIRSIERPVRILLECILVSIMYGINRLTIGIPPKDHNDSPYCDKSLRDEEIIHFTFISIVLDIWLLTKIDCVSMRVFSVQSSSSLYDMQINFLCDQEWNY